MKVAAVILAAGQGTRMRSDLPKVLHPLLGAPMIEYALQAVQGLSDFLPVIVVGHGADTVRRVVGSSAVFAVQERQLGTAHALQQAAPAVDRQAGLVLVTSGDMPLFRSDTLRGLIETQADNPGPLTITTLLSDEPRGFGRVVRKADGTVQAVVEEAQATPEQLAIRELNAGAYCFEAGWLWQALARIPVSPKGEYYLTDAIGLAAGEGLPVRAVVLIDPHEALGINTRVHLAEAEALLRSRVNTAWMEAGVTLVDPLRTLIEPGVTIGHDTVIWPNTYLHGSTQIGQACEIGPDAVLRDTLVGASARVFSSTLEGWVVSEGEEIGPYTSLSTRKAARLAAEQTDRD